MKLFKRILKLIALPLLIAIGIYSFIRFVWLADTNEEFSFMEINTQQYLELYYNLEESVVFITKDDMENKGEYEQFVKDSFNDKEINVYYYNITNITEADLLDFEVSTGIKGDYQLPLLVYTLNGDVYDYLEGYKQKHYIVDFINRNNIR